MANQNVEIVVILYLHSNLVIQRIQSLIKTTYLKDHSLSGWKFLIILITNSMAFITKWKIGMENPIMQNTTDQYIYILLILDGHTFGT